MLGAGVWHALLLVPLWLLGGVCNGGLNVSMNVAMAARVPAFARGRAFASMGSAVQGAGIIGFLVGGPLVDRIEPRVLFAAFGAAGLLAVLACVPVVGRAVRSGHPRTRCRAAGCWPEIASGHERHRPASARDTASWSAACWRSAGAKWSTDR
jgi:MFS family permease